MDKSRLILGTSIYSCTCKNGNVEIWTFANFVLGKLPGHELQIRKCSHYFAFISGYIFKYLFLNCDRDIWTLFNDFRSKSEDFFLPTIKEDIIWNIMGRNVYYSGAHSRQTTPHVGDPPNNPPKWQAPHVGEIPSTTPQRVSASQNDWI